MQPTPSAQLGIDDLENVELIGSGGSAQVYRATQASFERDVAVKILNNADEQLNRRFDRERRAMGKLSSHSGIVPVYTSGTTSFGQPYLVMPFYGRGSLADQIKTGPMPWQEAVDHLAMVASTIGHAHQNGVLHLDLKPGNIMVADDGTPRVADFGIAKLLTDQTSRSATNTSFTPAYCPPEILTGQAPDSGADIYGLGATLWALIAGRPPFHTDETSANSIVAIMGRVAHEPPADLRNRAPDWVCRVVERAMAKNPAERYQTGEEMAAALQSGQSGLSGQQTAVAAAPGGFVPPSAHTQPVGPPLHDPGAVAPPSGVHAAAAFAAPAVAENETVQQAVAPAAASWAPTPQTGAPQTGAPQTGAPQHGSPPPATSGSKGPLIVGAGVLLIIIGLAAAFVLRGGDDPDLLAADGGATAAESADTSTPTTAASTDDGAGNDVDDINDTGNDAASTAEQPTTTQAPTTSEAPTTAAPTTTAPTTAPSSSAPAGELVGTSLAGRHGITLQWISFDSPDWGAIEFEPLGDERYNVSGRQDGADGDYVIVEGTMTKISDLELQFEGTVEVKVSYLADGQPCIREGQMTFLSTQNRQYWRMQNFQSPCDSQADYVDIYF